MKELKFNFSKAALKKTFAFMLAMCLCITSVGIHVEAKDAVVSYSETREQSQGDGEQSQGNGVASVTISPTSLELKEGASETLTVTVVMEDETSREITPGDAEIRVDWKSDAPEIATVDENGKVTAQKAGTTKIIATVDEQTAECTVTVTENVIQVTGVGLNKTTLSLKVGETEKLTATVVPATASYKTLTWDTSDAKTATVKDGVVTAVAKGTATITVKTVNGKTATCTVTVTEAEKPAAPVEATGVSLNATKLSLKTGKTATLTATVVPATASNKTITWSSNKESVATVSNAGVVTAKGNGTATITAKTVNGKTATCTVTVTTDATKVTLDNTKLTLAVGKSKTLKATINPSTTSNKALTWKSSDKKVATVDKKGKVTAKKAGTATITVTTANGKTATCKVTVAEVKLNASTIAVQKAMSFS